MVRQAPRHIAEEERWELEEALHTRKHLFGTSKGDLGLTSIVQHQINTEDHPAVKQQVRRYPAARRVEERKLVEDTLAIGIIQESNRVWSGLGEEEEQKYLVLHRSGHEGRSITFLFFILNIYLGRFIGVV